MSTAKKLFRKIFPILVITMIAATALTPAGTAYADGGDDPDTVEVTDPVPPEDDGGAGEEGGETEGSEEPQVTDPVPSEEEDAAVQEVTEPAASETDEPAPSTGSDSEAGETEPVDQTPAAEEEIPPDPQFCPDGFVFGDAGCEPSRATMAEAVTDWLSQAVDGIIFVEAGVFDGFTVDGYTGNTDLTIQGDANNSGTTFFTGASKVVNSVFNNLTFIDVSFEDGLYISNITANDGVAMDSVTADVTLDTVDVSGASGDGISISNHDGAVILENVTADNTGEDGIDIDNSASTEDKKVTISNSSASNNASGDGIKVTSNGKVLLTGVTASGNAGQGANIDNTSSTDPQYVKVTASTFDLNGSDGLFVDSSGSIYMLNVSADQSGNNGAELNAGVGTGPEAIIICTSDLTNNPGYGFAVDPNTGYVKLIQVNTAGNVTGPFTATNFSAIYFKSDCPFGQTSGSGNDGTNKKDTSKQSNTKIVDLDPDEETETFFFTYGITFPPMNIAECRGIITVPFSVKGLPAELPEDNLFAGGLLIDLDGCELPEDSEITVTFSLPPAEEEASPGSYAVLFWDQESGTWVDVPATPDPNDELKLIVSWPDFGAFVLVTH